MLSFLQEHTVNLLKHLLQLSDLLETGGKLFLVLPDKRFTFDYFRPLTTISDILQTYVEDPRVHSLRIIIESICEASNASTADHQNGNHGQRNLMASNTEDGQIFLNDCLAQSMLKYYNANGSYIDAHRWIFTDHWFYELIETLNQLGVLPLHIETLYPTVDGGSQFYVILSKTVFV
jgi:hypothetical protein